MYQKGRKTARAPLQRVGSAGRKWQAAVSGGRHGPGGISAAAPLSG
jgi:hypothetical protein